MKPFLKWAGGKYRIVDKIKAVLPAGSRLIEPFAGSAAVFLNTDYPGNLIADSNADLINVFKRIQTGGLEFIDYCEQLFVSENNRADTFYRLRAEFNATSDLQRKASLFIYLNRHCFNGLCRYNSSGGFNVPFGRYAKPALPKKEMAEFAIKSKSAQIEVADFLTTMGKATLGDVVYCDPPYVPLMQTSNFTDYTSEGFGVREQNSLAEMARELALRGIPVVISNHDTEFTRDAYAAAQISSFTVQRFISCDATNRKKANELLAIFN